MKTFIKTYPVIFGVLVSLAIAACIFAFLPIEERYPGIGVFLSRHSQLIRGAGLTALAFAVWLGCAWKWRRRSGFWTSLFLFYVLHSATLVVYSRKFHPLAGRQWEYVLVFESYLLALFLYVGTHWRSIMRKLGKRSTQLSSGDNRLEIGNLK
jgi:hypothetical protein